MFTYGPGMSTRVISFQNYYVFNEITPFWVIAPFEVIITQFWIMRRKTFNTLGLRNIITYIIFDFSISKSRFKKPYPSHWRQWKTTVSTDVTVVYVIHKIVHQSRLFYGTTMTKMRFNLECKKQLTRPQKLYKCTLNKTIAFTL